MWRIPEQFIPLKRSIYFQLYTSIVASRRPIILFVAFICACNALITDKFTVCNLLLNKRTEIPNDRQQKQLISTDSYCQETGCVFTRTGHCQIILSAHQTLTIIYSHRNWLMHTGVLMSFLSQEISINFHVKHLLFVVQHAKRRLIIILANGEYLSSLEHCAV